MNNTYRYPSPLGTILLTAQKGALTGARFVDGPADADPSSDPVLSEAAAWLARCFAGGDPGPVPPCAPTGTPFQMRVWNALRTVGYGETCSYGELCARIGLTSRHARAVGAAVGKNPLVLFLPCHRIVGASGALTGYAFGLDRKAALLAAEHAGSSCDPARSV